MAFKALTALLEADATCSLHWSLEWPVSNSLYDYSFIILQTNLVKRTLEKFLDKKEKQKSF